MTLFMALPMYHVAGDRISREIPESPAHSPSTRTAGVGSPSTERRDTTSLPEKAQSALRAPRGLLGCRRFASTTTLSPTFSSVALTFFLLRVTTVASSVAIAIVLPFLWSQLDVQRICRDVRNRPDNTVVVVCRRWRRTDNESGEHSCNHQSSCHLGVSCQSVFFTVCRGRLLREGRQRLKWPQVACSSGAIGVDTLPPRYRNRDLVSRILTGSAPGFSRSRP